jgi:hypothetical protein
VDDQRKKAVEFEKPKSILKKPVASSKVPTQVTNTVAKAKFLTNQGSTSTLSDKSRIAPPQVKGKGKDVARNEKSSETLAAQSLHPPSGPSKPAPSEPAAEEWIDLPEPNSEYSDSGDEGKAYEVADWAQSPVLMEQLGRQQTIDPDDIFGPIQPLRMEELFRTRQSRFRARTSSANWSGPDGLSELEAREYARRMGFR